VGETVALLLREEDIPQDSFSLREVILLDPDSRCFQCREFDEVIARRAMHSSDLLS
jgi:hypothetical protein